MVGPFTYLRPGTVLGADGKLGAFVETKNSTIGSGTKVPHLTYVGDADIGEHSNIGASSVFVNYDGTSKQRTTVGSHVRTGSDTMFVAPVTVGDGAYTGAGTVVREDVPPGALAVSGGQQRNIEGWVERKRPGSAAAEAAEKARAAGDRDALPGADGDQHDGNRAASERFATYYSVASHTEAHHPQAINWVTIRSEPARATVSYDWTDNRKNLMLFAGRSHPELAEQVAKELDVHVTAQTARDFANGEIFVRFDESVRGCDAFVLQSHPAPVNQWLMEQLIMIDALKRGSAKRITAVVPFYPVCPSGQEAPRARADLGTPGRRPVQDRGRGSDRDRRPAHRPDPGLLRRARRPHARAEPADRLPQGQLRRRQHGRGLPRLRPGADRREVGRRDWAASRWRSFTRPATRGCPTRWCPTGWSVRCRGTPAC